MDSLRNTLDKNADILRKLYVYDKMSTTQISNISKESFGRMTGAGTIYSALIRNGIPVRSKSESISRAVSRLDFDVSFLNEKRLEWIDGFLLGDGYIGFVHDESHLGARFLIGSSQKEWTDYGMSGLQEYSPTEVRTTYKIRKRQPNPIWSSRSLTHPDIVLQAKRWYPNGKKIIPKDVRITPISLLLWYLGDGSISKMGVSFFIRLATCSFSISDIEEILMPKLLDLGLDVSRHVSKNDIKISGKSLKRFFELIGKKSPIACYNYKFEYGDWLNLYRLSEVVKNDKEKWRVQYLFKNNKLDCQISPGGRLIMFTKEQKDKIRRILDGHSLHYEYKPVIHTVGQEEDVRLSDIVQNDNERWNARYLITRKVVKCVKSMLTKDQAILLRDKLNSYGANSAIPSYMIDNEFRQYREAGFPYYRFTDDELNKKIKTIINFEPILLDGKFKWSGHGTELANFFHPHMFECSKKGRLSPIEFFNSDIDFKRGIKKIIALYPSVSASKIREICCNETASSRINNFPPKVMISILKHLYHDGSNNITMMDPCAGFSGRLIGAFASGVVGRYIGIDLSEKTYNGLIKTSNFINKLDRKFESDILLGNCLDVMGGIRDVDLVFTSPPFLDEEKYVGVEVESDYGKWKDVFIRPFIEKSYNSLRSGGILSVYTEAIRRTDFSSDFSYISEGVGFKKLEGIRFSVAARENLRKNGKTNRVVEVLVFRKA